MRVYLTTSFKVLLIYAHPNSKVHGANMGPIWGRRDPGGPHVGPMDFAIWGNWYGHLSKMQMLPCFI